MDPAEVSDVHRVPIAELTDPGNRVNVRHPSGYIGPGFTVHDMLVWGFTAHLLDRILARWLGSALWDQDVSWTSDGHDDGLARSDHPMGIVDLIILGVLLMVALIRVASGVGAQRAVPGGHHRRRTSRRSQPSLDPEQPRRAGPARRRDQCRCGARRSGLGQRSFGHPGTSAVDGAAGGTRPHRGCCGRRCDEPVRRAHRDVAGGCHRGVPAFPPTLASAVRSSALLQQVERLAPSQATDLAYSVRQLLDQVHLPEVFFGLEGLPGNKVPKPPKNVSDAAVVASQSVLRLGPTPACGQGSTGSGFVYTTDRIATNAHVVAGMSQVRVVASDGRSWGADVVYFNADLDLAVLFVPGLGVRPLEASRQVQDADPAIIAGYPGGGPLDLRSARIVTRTSGEPGVLRQHLRQTHKTRARSSSCVAGHPGNSGGPLLTRDGRYAGVIFASSQQYKRTGFALTNKSVGQALRNASDRNIPVETGDLLAVESFGWWAAPDGEHRRWSWVRMLELGTGVGVARARPSPTAVPMSNGCA